MPVCHSYVSICTKVWGTKVQGLIRSEPFLRNLWRETNSGFPLGSTTCLPTLTSIGHPSTSHSSLIEPSSCVLTNAKHVFSSGTRQLMDRAGICSVNELFASVLLFIAPVQTNLNLRPLRCDHDGISRFKNDLAMKTSTQTWHWKYGQISHVSFFSMNALTWHFQPKALSNTQKCPNPTNFNPKLVY